MSRPRKSEETVRVNACTMLLPDILEEIDRIALHSRRSRSQVIEMLVTRGYRRFKSDGQLAESEQQENPENADYRNIGAVAHIDEARRIAMNKGEK